MLAGGDITLFLLRLTFLAWEEEEEEEADEGDTIVGLVATMTEAIATENGMK